MSDYIKREDAIQEVIYELDAFDHVPQALIDRIKRDFDTLPTADVAECSELLKEADRQEKLGFIQTADAMRKVAKHER